jgi:hypothetical protein
VPRGLNSNLAVTSADLGGIESAEIIEAIMVRRAPTLPGSAFRRL